ncbi:hypothetical protein EU545_00835 [Candidatus Thorarchaeota archaeon]|nr:MAG: hypothetical protein EU545_00835 [Candidatus Thorarchaeota archaeon]
MAHEDWIASYDEVARELASFAEEFGTFTPELFAEIKIHLLRSGLTKSARDDICTISIGTGLCPECDLLYEMKKCLLWYRLYDLVSWRTVERAPPCIRLAYAKKTIKTVANYLSYIDLIDPPFYQKRMPPSCNMLDRWGYCNPNEYCRAMKTGNPIEYSKAREAVKIARGFKHR